MNEFAAAVAGTVTALGVGAVMVARLWPVPPGRHRAGRPVPEPMLRPVEALEQIEAYCPAEDRPTLQIRLRLGGMCCTECRNPVHTTTAQGESQ